MVSALNSPDRTIQAQALARVIVFYSWAFCCHTASSPMYEYVCMIPEIITGPIGHDARKRRLT